MDDQKKPEPAEKHREPSWTPPAPLPQPAGPGKRAAPDAALRRLGLVSDGAILLAILLVVLAAFGARAQEAPEPARPYAYGYAFTANDRYLLAQARVHEAGWREGVADAGGILQVVMERRRASETFEMSLARTMPHFYGRDTRRLWVRELPNGPIRRNPPSWVYAYPARHHADAWRDANEEAAGYMNGSISLPFAHAPTRWFGRETDGEQLEVALAEGWCEPAGAVTLNAFLVRGRASPGGRCEEDPAEVDGTSSAGPSGPLALEIDPE